MPPGISPQEREDVLARLARSEVVGLRFASNQATYGKELVDAYARYERICKPAKGKEVEVFVKMLKLLSSARLTINFKAGAWFYNENKYQTYTNFHERGYSGASSDMQKRDAAEMEFGRYAGSGTGTDTEKRIANYGVKTSANFNGAVRPRYAAVDFAFVKEGAASKYGKSFLILKEHMKHGATYVPRDSFEVNLDLSTRKAEYGGVSKNLNDVTGTFFEMGKVLLYCDPGTLTTIYKYASGEKSKGSEAKVLGGLTYIEAHLHADIQFKRDLEAVVISRDEMQAGIIPHPKFYASWPNKKTVWDMKDAKRVEENAKKFAKANGVKVDFV